MIELENNNIISIKDISSKTSTDK